MQVSGYLYAIGAAITWGLVYTIDQKILTATNPVALLFVNSLITTIIILPFALAKRGSLTAFLGHDTKLWILIVLSIGLAALASVFIFSSIKTLGASTASIFEIMYPFFVVLFTLIAYRTTPTWHFIVGAVLIFAGVFFIMYHSGKDTEAISAKTMLGHPRTVKHQHYHRASRLS